MKVRFKKEYSDIPDVRLSYELVSDELVFDWHTYKQGWCYNTKLLGSIPAYKMEPSEDTDIPEIDVFVHLTNNK